MDGMDTVIENMPLLKYNVPMIIKQTIEILTNYCFFTCSKVNTVRSCAGWKI